MTDDIVLKKTAGFSNLWIWKIGGEDACPFLVEGAGPNRALPVLNIGSSLVQCDGLFCHKTGRGIRLLMSD